MKLTLLGAGVRAPLFAAAALRRAKRIGLDELWLLDTDPERLSLFGGISAEMARRAGATSLVHLTDDPRAALRDAAHVVVAIRVGGEEARILDERIALRHGVLGQETTGPGGFAMALRSIPAVLGYARLLSEVSPDAWLYSFTNPAGLVAQALRDAGFGRAVGICDGANRAQHAVAAWYGIDGRSLRSEAFGLNHLSWTRSVSLGTEDLLGPVLLDPGFRAQSRQHMFDLELSRQVGMWMNEYLYYYHYAERAVAEILADGKTRGEEVLEMTQRLLGELRPARRSEHPDAALEAFRAYHQRRSATYMHFARPDAPDLEQADSAAYDGRPEESEDEGYAGAALDVIEALATGEPLWTALNVPNQGAIDGLRDGDVVEVSCLVDGRGIEPVRIGQMPEPQAALVAAVKAYERFTVEAVAHRSRDLAITALMAHPLVLSYPRASSLVDEYLAAHREYIDWDVSGDDSEAAG